MSNIFNGVPIDTQAFSIFDATYYIFYKDYKYYIHNYATNTTSAGVAFGAGTSVMTQIPTGQTINMGYVNAGSNWIYINVGSNWYKFSYVLSSGVPSFTYISTTSNANWFSGGMPTSGWDGIAPYANGSDMWLFNGSAYFQAAYGGTGQPFDGLPHDLGCVDIRIDDTLKGWAFKGDKYYEITLTYSGIGGGTALIGRRPSGGTLVSSGTLPSSIPVVPPTPLPDIEVVYSAPSQFNLFASDVALVTENQYGWNFTKTINDSNKMELYLFHSSVPGAFPFTYSQLRDIKVNMKNNLVLPTGEIFVTVYTGPAVAPNWYNYKDIYNFTPPLGTTIDAALVEHILNLTDVRTDPILAIALHSNSAQQQVNCDVERVSFEILLPATNETQRVIVKLQNNFIALDNHYWDLDNTATARLNTTIIPAFDINSFNPNIVAGNFPQNAITAKESTSGCALFVSGTWQYWETTDGTTWTATPNATITLIAQTSATPAPGPSSNGFAYIGTQGMFDNYGTAFPTATRPVVWEVTTSNQLQFTWTGASGQSYAPLSNMATPNNFTAAQIASGFFDTLATAGSTAVGVFISTATSPSGEPVASRDIDIVVKSETEISIKRSWELSVTTYIINVNNPKEITGQYTDPVYTTSVAPTSFSMPTNWLETANNAEHFEILFSGGLNNSLPAESQNSRQMTVTPTPSNTELTFTWVANYYTIGNILISPVLGIGTSGLVSSFITGGSLKPANAHYILYGCTSSDNVDAFTSLVFIEPVASGSFDLTFSSGLNNQISADGTYSVAPSTFDATSTYAYTAVFRDISGASLGAVPGAGASGSSSSFTIAYASLPANVAYIDYNASATGGGQDGEVAQLSITIVPEVVPPTPPPVAFDLTFSGGLNNQILSDGTYSVAPSPVDATSTYAYTAVFRDISGTALGAVPGAGASGVSSSFTISYVALPSNVVYIDYNATATGGGQDGEVSQLSITIIPEVVPPTPPPGNDDLELIRSTTGSIIFNQYNSEDSLKKLTGDRLTGLTMTLTDSYGDTIYSPAPVYYELNIRSSNSG